MLHTALAVAAGVVAIAFCMSTFDRWLARRRPHELAWTTAFALFAAGALCLAIGAQGGWTADRFRWFYLFGAVLNVPFLALGTTLLLAGPTAGRRATAGVTLFAAFATGIMLAAPLTGTVPVDRLPQGSEVFGAWPRVLAAVASGGGATVVLGGALWSAIRRRTRRAVMGNLLISAGTLILGASGLLNSMADAMTAFAVTLTSGVGVLFLGFLVLTSGAGPVVVDRKASSG